MLILALESSAKPASATVCRDGLLLGQYYQNSGLTHSRTLLEMADELLNNLGLSINDMELVAVSNGPGSFTGVRIGVSAAKGLAWGADLPVCGVSTLEAMVYQLAQPGVIICPVMDARRNQVYNALFQWDNEPVRLCEDRAVSLEQLAVELKNAALPCVLIGDGSAISYDYLTAAGVGCQIAPELLRYQTAFGVALAAMNSAQKNAAELEPCYLRPSQAERERGARSSGAVS